MKNEVFTFTDKLDDIINKYNNTYHNTIKMKPVNVKSNKCINSWNLLMSKSKTYINSNKGINDKDPIFEIGDTVRMSKYKNIFSKGYVPSWSEDVFVIKKVKNTVLWTYVISDFKGGKIVGTFYEKELQKNESKRV